GVDIAGKIVIILRHLPRWGDKESPFGKNKESLAGLEKKVALAEANKAIGVIVVNDAAELINTDVIPPFSYLQTATSSRIPCVHVKRSAIDPILRGGLGKSLIDLEKGIDFDMKPASAPLADLSVKIEATVSRTMIPVKNVIGVLPGNGPLAKEFVV